LRFIAIAIVILGEILNLSASVALPYIIRLASSQIPIRKKIYLLPA